MELPIPQCSENALMCTSTSDKKLPIADKRGDLFTLLYLRANKCIIQSDLEKSLLDQDTVFDASKPCGKTPQERLKALGLLDSIL